MSIPIFASQLGKVEEQNPEKAVKTLANHLRKIQEELEYRLMHLDSSNVSEIDANSTSITLDGKPLKNVIIDNDRFSSLEQTIDGLYVTVSDQGQNISQLQVTANGIATKVENQAGQISTLVQTADGLQTKVSSLEGNYSSLTQTTDGLQLKVSTLEGNVSTLQQTANGIQLSVSDLDGRLSTLTQTASGLQSKVSTLEGNVSTLTQTATGLQSKVEGVEGSVSALTQTASSLTASVEDLTIGMGHMLKMDANGVYIVDKDGRAVTIQGGQVNAATLNLTGYISFNDLTDGNSVLGSINTAYNLADSAYGLAEAAYELAENGEWPDYIHTTYISNAEVRSPSIFGGMFYATGRGRYTEAAYYLYDSWSASKGLGNQVGYLSYDDDGAGTAEEAAERVLLTSTNGTALKLNAAGNMSLESGNRIYMMSTTVFGAPILLTSGYGFGTSLPSSGTPGQLFFLR